MSSVFYEHTMPQRLWRTVNQTKFRSYRYFHSLAYPSKVSNSGCRKSLRMTHIWVVQSALRSGQWSALFHESWINIVIDICPIHSAAILEYWMPPNPWLFGGHLCIKEISFLRYTRGEDVCSYDRISWPASPDWDSWVRTSPHSVRQFNIIIINQYDYCFTAMLWDKLMIIENWYDKFDYVCALMQRGTLKYTESLMKLFQSLKRFL